MTKDEILQKVKCETRIRGLSKNTQDEYYTKAKQFQDYYDKPVNGIWTYIGVFVPEQHTSQTYIYKDER